MKDDAVSWMNYTEEPSPAEKNRLYNLVDNKKLAYRLLNFGLRPMSVVDLNPDIHPEILDKPFLIKEEHLLDERILVDVYTGARFIYDKSKRNLKFEHNLSNNSIDGLELLMRASHRFSDELPFKSHKRMDSALGFSSDFPSFSPLEFSTNGTMGLNEIIEKLNENFVGNYGVKKLWFRGQRTEYLLNRDNQITTALYGYDIEPSLIPSLGRFVKENPESTGFGLSFFANHKWKKPFLIWMIMENDQWFPRESKFKDVLMDILINPDDSVFSQLLAEIQMPPDLFGKKSISNGVYWPDEVDDLRQWFFAYMKRHEYGITLQQYGYPSSLLDLTDSTDVALYFSQSKMIDGKFQVLPPEKGRVMYVFAERTTGDFFRHGQDLFWGDHEWSKKSPPRLHQQKAGFLMGATCRNRNFYSHMIIAKIWLDNASDITSLKSEDLFPYHSDKLYQSFKNSRPKLEELY